MSDPLVELLLTDYNVYRGQTQHLHAKAQENPHVKRWLKARPETLKMLAQMVSWCRVQQVEPRLWLFYLFRFRSWRFAPKLVESDLMSVKALEKYKPQERLGFFRVHTRNYALVQDDSFDPNRDTTSSVEAVKTRYQETGQHLQCMQEQLLTTLGYHPKSKVCAACPVRETCAVQLEGAVPFSMLAVREGRLTAAQAELISRRGGKW